MDSKGATSGWSNETAVVINDPPNFPPNTRPNLMEVLRERQGPLTATPHTQQILIEIRVTYTFDWGDGTTDETGYVASGTQAAVSPYLGERWNLTQVKAMATIAKVQIQEWSAAKDGNHCRE